MNKLYMAVGEEAARGTGEVSTVGFIPLNDASIPVMEFNESRRPEWRGEDRVLGDQLVTRLDQKWGATLNMPFFTEAGTTAGMIGTILKHFFGKVTSAQNASTGQYLHMMYPVSNPFAAANLDNDALTFSLNINEGDTMKNWPFLGGRISELTFEQEAPGHLNLAIGCFGQKRDTTTAELGSAVYAAENLRCDFNNLTVYTGTITRVGTPPDYTDFTFGSATQLKPASINLKLENGFEDVLRLDGLDYSDKTRVAMIKATLELTIDWEDPAAGFSSADEFNAWVASVASTNFHLFWDTGTQAGTGDNHALHIDLPVMNRMGGEPEYDLERDPMVTLRYEGLYDASTTLYLVGLMLKNTATAV